jgi:Rrf2 family protein
MFSQTTEYALRAVAYLAERAPELASTREISTATQVPQPYLSKVLQALIKNGLLVGQRGGGGGIRLNVPLDQLTMLDVVNVVEPIERIHGCPLGLAAHRARLCSTHSRLDRALEVMEEVLSASTFAEMLAESPSADPGCQFPHVVRKPRKRAQPRR